MDWIADASAHREEWLANPVNHYWPRVWAARAFLYESTEEAQVHADRGQLLLDHRASLRLAATHATRSSAEAVDLMYDAGGGSSIYSKNLLQRCFRDVHVATQHAMVAPAMYAPLLCFDFPGGHSVGASELIRPRTGLMIIFPAWLSHAVRPYRGDRARISIAFNLSI